MTRIVLLPELAADFERIRTHLAGHQSVGADNRSDAIIKAIDALSDNPLVGRRLEEGMRELVIGRDARGYVALYRYLEELDTVIVLAIRAQREAGYARDTGSDA